MKLKLASYECLRCSCKWEQKQGPSVGWNREGLAIHPNSPPSKCPMCGNLYIKWINYKDFDIYKKKVLDKH
jgi:hypothetical protein